MARVENVMERFQGPLYDSVSVDGGQQIGDVEKSGTLKFFVNVQGKTKLETNLQSASLLPHYNTFEARAMRVVISDLPPEYPADENQGPLATTDDVEVSDPDGQGFAVSDSVSDSVVVTPPPSPDLAITARVETTIDRLARLFKEASESDDGTAELDVDDDAVTLVAADGSDIGDQTVIDAIANSWGNRCPLQRRLGGHERRLEDESHPQGAARSQQRFRNNHRQAHLQHGNNAVRRREANDLDADLVLPGGCRPLLGNGQIHHPRRALAERHVPLRRAGLHRQAAELPGRDRDSRYGYP